jgi:16S rRNA (guanine966-N2)-methyltransferase
LRIIAGQRRGKRLAAPTDSEIRPTADRLRESIFNIITGRVGNARVLDLFAGTGAMGLEALSRGAVHACFVDSNAKAVALIERNLAACGFGGRSRVIRCDALKLLELPAQDLAYDLVFMDPPYSRGLVAPALASLLSSPLPAQNAFIVVEHATDEVLPFVCVPWRCVDQRRYGKTLVSFVSAML